MHKLHYNGPVVLAILDGVGLRSGTQDNAVKQAHLEFLNSASKNYPNIKLNASGAAVGLLKDQAGNSEAGHNTMGCGQIIEQGLARTNKAFATGAVWQSQAWHDAITRVTDTQPGSTLHFAGIFSDGGVHSDISHLEKMIDKAHEQGVKKIRIHAIFDGIDVEPKSSLQYVQRVEKQLQQYPDCDYQIASGAGRAMAVADCGYENWEMVQTGWQMMVHGEAVHNFHNTEEAIKHFYDQDSNLTDDNIPAFVITDGNGVPVGPMNKGDSVIYWDFRADCAKEITEAFTKNHFKPFNRSAHLQVATAIANDPASAAHLPTPDARPDIFFVGMTEYDHEKHLPVQRLVEPPIFEHTLTQYLNSKNISQLAVSETARFAHITYYFNGNRDEQLQNEEQVEINDDQKSVVARPWMKAAEIADVVIEKLDQYQFVRVNFPNADVIGKERSLETAIVALEAVDIQLQRIATEVERLGGMMLIVSDHGNVEDLTKTHTNNPVPCIFYDNTDNKQKYQVVQTADAGLANMAATVAALLGQSDYPDVWQKPLIDLV